MPQCEFEGDRLAWGALGAVLVDVGAHRRLHQIDEAAQDAVFIEARDARKRGLDRSAHSTLVRRAALQGRIEAGAEKGHDAACDGGVGGEGRRKIRLPVAHAQLPEVAAEGAQQRRILPGQAGLQHEAIVAIRFRPLLGHGEQRRLQRLAPGVKVHRAAGALQQHVVDEDALRHAGRPDAIGALVDHPEAEVFQHRHPVRQGQRGAAGKHLQADLLRRIALATADVDGAGMLLAQGFQDSDVGHGSARGKTLAIGGRKSLAVAARERPRRAPLHGLAERFAQLVAPGAHDRGDLGFEDRGIELDQRRVPRPDDVMGAGEQPLGEVGVRGRQPAPQPLGEMGADAGADRRIIAVLEDVDEERSEAAEPVEPRQHADARPVGEVGDGQGEGKEPVDAYLEQLVARIGFEHRHQTAPRMARGIELRARRDGGLLAAEIGDCMGGAVVGRGGEQPQDAQQAGQPAGDGEQFYGDVVDIGGPMHPRPGAPLADGDGARPVEEGRDRRHGIVGQRGPARRPQQAEARTGEGHGGPLHRLLAEAEQGEVPVAQPGQEGLHLGDLGVGQRQGRAAIAGFERFEPGDHGRPVVGGEGHVGEDAGEAGFEFGPGLRVVEAVEMDVDQALAAERAASIGRGLADDAQQGAVRVALDAENGMGDQQRHKAPFAQRRERRIEQEGTVVVDHLDDRQVARPAVARHRHVVDVQAARRARRAGSREVAVDGRREVGEALGGIGRQILGRYAPEQVEHHVPRPVGLAEQPGRGFDQVGAPALGLGTRQCRRRFESHHASPCHRWREVRPRCPIHARRPRPYSIRGARTRGGRGAGCRSHTMRCRGKACCLGREHSRAVRPRRRHGRGTILALCRSGDGRDRVDAGVGSRSGFRS